MEKKEIFKLYQEAPNRPRDIADPKKLMKKPIGEIIIHLADLVMSNKPSLAGRLARPFRIQRPFDPFPWMH
jgi:hypothetical protein